jgi:hypothetical protein
MRQPDNAESKSELVQMLHWELQKTTLCKRRSIMKETDPAILKSIVTDAKTGTVRSITYGFEGFESLRNPLHRDPAEGPAYEAFDASGNPTLKIYSTRDGYSRDDGPAFIYFHPGTDRVSKVGWYRSQKLHRDPSDGPAEYSLDLNGLVIKDTVRFAVDGKSVPSPRDIRFPAGPKMPGGGRYAVDANLG